MMMMVVMVVVVVIIIAVLINITIIIKPCKLCQIFLIFVMAKSKHHLVEPLVAEAPSIFHHHPFLYILLRKFALGGEMPQS